MKKVFLLMTLAVATAISAWATDYSEFITITINGETTAPIQSTVTLEQEEGLSTYSFTLRNFILPGETAEEDMYVGNVQLTGLTLMGAGEEKTFATTQNISIQPGDDGGDYWFGPFLGEIPVTVNGRIIGDTEALVIIDIDLMEAMGQILTVTFANQNIYQMANSDFETWETVTYGSKSGEEPVKWSSFLDGTGTLKSAAGYCQLYKESTEKRPGTTGLYSAKLTSRAVKILNKVVAVAQGNLTNGCINMGSMTATDASGNYNYINTAREDQSMRFSGMPDAVKVWVKHNGTKSANVATLFTTNGYYQDPVANNITATKVASAIKNDIPSNNTWTEYTIPVTYEDGVSERPYYVLITLSTCAEAGKGAESDVTYFDDITMVYNSELTGAKYDNVDINFVAGAATINEVYDPSKLTDLTSNGHAATIVPAYNEETALLTISVYADNFVEDVTNVHTYTVQFNYPDYSRDIENNKYGTLCLPFNAEVEGATLYTISDVTDNGVILSAVEGNNTEAGKAYIFKATSEELVASFSARAALGTNQGIVGNIKATDKTLTAEDNAYIIGSDNALHLIAGTATATIKQYRAYIDLSQFSANVAGRVRMITEEEMIATDIEEVETCKAVKFVENGNLYIKKNGRVYNALGQIVR